MHLTENYYFCPRIRNQSRNKDSYEIIFLCILLLFLLLL
nr:MAG TPA: hypothetical protein [Caudoviricetes sp.]